MDIVIPSESDLRAYLLGNIKDKQGEPLGQGACHCICNCFCPCVEPTITKKKENRNKKHLLTKKDG
jgi:hypothetical protein